MSVRFFTSREFPSELKSLNGYRHYGDALTDIGNIVQKASPWDFLKGIFVDKPIAQAQAQEMAAQIQAQAVAEQQMQQQSTIRTVALVGAGLVGLLVVASILRGPPQRVSGYRRQKRRSRR